MCFGTLLGHLENSEAKGYIIKDLRKEATWPCMRVGTDIHSVLTVS